MFFSSISLAITALRELVRKGPPPSRLHISVIPWCAMAMTSVTIRREAFRWTRITAPNTEEDSVHFRGETTRVDQCFPSKLKQKNNLSQLLISSYVLTNRFSNFPRMTIKNSRSCRNNWVWLFNANPVCLETQPSLRESVSQEKGLGEKSS